MGLFLDNADEVTRVYTAVFPSPRVVRSLYQAEATSALLFVHHPMTWDIRLAPSVFQPIPIADMEALRARRISVYALHTPLDRNGPFSTTVTLAEALGFTVLGDLEFDYCGVRPCVICRVEAESLTDLSHHYSDVLGHPTSLYRYGDEANRDRLVAMAAGGGNIPEVLGQVQRQGINTYLTGVTVHNEVTRPAHDLARQHRISLLGGTHYSTEKFACQAMCRYFRELGVEAEFLEDLPILEDL